MWAHDKDYYNFVQNFTLSDEEDRDCVPPYNNYTNPYCWDLSKYNQTLSHIDDPDERLRVAKLRNIDTVLPPEIFKCYTGLIPYWCPTINQTSILPFVGYFDPS